MGLSLSLPLPPPLHDAQKQLSLGFTNHLSEGVEGSCFSFLWLASSHEPSPGDGSLESNGFSPRDHKSRLRLKADISVVNDWHHGGPGVNYLHLVCSALACLPRVCMHVCVLVCMHVHVCMHEHMSVHACIHVHVRACMCVCVCVHACMCELHV